MSSIDKKLKEMSDFRTVFITSIISALTLVVGLFWNDAIKSLLEDIVPAKEGTFYKFVAAFIVTILVVVAAYLIIHSQRVADKKLKELKALQEKRLKELEIQRAIGLKNFRIIKKKRRKGTLF